MPRSTFYNLLKSTGREDPDGAIKDAVKSIYENSRKGNERYGYRRVTLVLRKTETYSHVNHKKVERIMRELGLFGYVSKNDAKKYSSYQGNVGKVADNIVARHFDAEEPDTLWSTDITEFYLPKCDRKVYLSPIKDFCDGSIVSHKCSTSPNMSLVMSMLDSAFAKHPDLKGLVFHSDQGWQYQNPSWVERLKSMDIVQSMSRKGNCLDNSKMETFFATLKKAIWFGFERKYESPEELVAAIDDYIRWYNEERIQVKLGGLSPLQFREQVCRLLA